MYTRAEHKGRESLPFTLALTLEMEECNAANDRFAKVGSGMEQMIVDSVAWRTKRHPGESWMRPQLSPSSKSAFNTAHLKCF